MCKNSIISHIINIIIFVIISYIVRVFGNVRLLYWGIFRLYSFQHYYCLKKTHFSAHLFTACTLYTSVYLIDYNNAKFHSSHTYPLPSLSYHHYNYIIGCAHITLIILWVTWIWLVGWFVSLHIYYRLFCCWLFVSSLVIDSQDVIGVRLKTTCTHQLTRVWLGILQNILHDFVCTVFWQCVALML